MPAGSPLTQARRIAADSSPPDRRWLKPAGSTLTHARRPPLSLAPWIKSTLHGQECRVSVLLCPQEHFKEPCLVHGDSSGAGGSSCCGHGGHSSRLPPCRGSGSGCWGTLWGPLMSCHAQRKPQLPSQPRRASGSCGMSCPVCLALEGLSCPVMYCSVCPAPEGSWYPLTSPGKFWGGRRVPAGVAWPRDEAMASRAPSSAMASVVCSALEVPVLCSCPFLSCPEGPPERPPPPPRWNCYGMGHAFREGGVMSGFCCVSSVPASCVHIWFVSCACFMSLWVNLCPAVCMWCVNFPVYLVPVFWVWFRLVYSLLPGVSCLSALSCPALMSWLNTIIWVYVLVCVSLFLPRVCTVTTSYRKWHNFDGKPIVET